MSDILIRGMELPKDCRECPFFEYNAEADFMCTIMRDVADCCPLIELPPHGRLIDADAFFEDFPEMRDYEWASQEYDVLPADPAEEENT